MTSTSPIDTAGAPMTKGLPEDLSTSTPSEILVSLMVATTAQVRPGVRGRERGRNVAGRGLGSGPPLSARAFFPRRTKVPGEEDGDHGDEDGHDELELLDLGEGHIVQLLHFGLDQISDLGDGHIGEVFQIHVVHQQGGRIASHPTHTIIRTNSLASS